MPNISTTGSSYNFGTYKPYYKICTTDSATCDTGKIYFDYNYANGSYCEMDDTSDYGKNLINYMEVTIKNEILRTMELRMAIDAEMKRVITEESVLGAKRALAELMEQISSAKKEVSDMISQKESIHKELDVILKKKEEMREQIDAFHTQFQMMMAEVEKATEAYAKKNLRFALLDV